jgi:malate synthase
MTSSTLSIAGHFDDDQIRQEILTGEALEFLRALHARFDSRRHDLLRARPDGHRRLTEGRLPDFLESTAPVRDADWTVAPPAPGLIDRRVEITGPTDRKMAINALNAGARVWLADLEDSSTPTWENVVRGQLNLRDAVDRTIEFRSDAGKQYSLDPTSQTTIVVRPRGLHFPENHLQLEGRPASGSLVDFGLYFFHCARRLIDTGTGPYFYLPKLESHLEARLWNDIFAYAQDLLGIPHGTVRATTLIETIPAAFEMEEILYELREHSAGLNAGRWDYIFSTIKVFRSSGRDYLLPDRGDVTMTVPFMRSYTELLVRTCHKRGAHAIGGMAASIPSKDPQADAMAFERVRQDKTREADDGFDGSWVAHPAMVALCDEVFTAKLGASPNQLHVLREDVSVAAADLLAISSTPGVVTAAGLRNNVAVGILYLQAWLAGNGAVAIFDLMEDAATAEISRSQVWQWLHNDVTLDTGENVDKALITRVVDEEIAKLPLTAEEYAEARDLFVEMAIADDFAEFLTLPAYEILVGREDHKRRGTPE